MPPANAATIAVLLILVLLLLPILVLLLLPTAFGASLLATPAVSRTAVLGPRDEALVGSDLPDAAVEGRTASSIAGEGGVGTSAAPGCPQGQGTGSSHDTEFWRGVADTSHDDDFAHDVADRSHDQGLVMEACDLADSALGTPVGGSELTLVGK